MSTVMDKPKGDTRSRRKKRVALVTAALLTVSGGAAIAYWTVGGTGTGKATTGTSENAVTVVQTSTVTNLRPGGDAQPLSGTFNNGNAKPVYVETVTASIESVAFFGQNVPAGCDKGDYILTDPTMSVNNDVEAGDGKGAWGGATIAFNNKAAVNQDYCKGGIVTLKYTVK